MNQVSDTPLNSDKEPLSSAAEHILSAAARLFSEKGFAGCSMQDVAAAAGVSKANVFHHFGNKQGLYLAVIRGTIEEFGRRLSNLVHCPGSSSKRVEHVVSAHLQHLLKRRGETHLILRELFEAGPGVRSAVTPIIGGNFSQIVRMIADGQERGELDSGVDPASAAMLLVGGNIMFFMSSQILQSSLQYQSLSLPDSYADDVARIMLRGLSKCKSTDCE
ncbi:MAG: hypothetical protein Tsb002_12770 [Wenzhouxiangellaceae bacterium]